MFTADDNDEQEGDTERRATRVSRQEPPARWRAEAAKDDQLSEIIAQIEKLNLSGKI